MSLVKSCSQCTRSAQNGDYCNYFNRRTLTRGEAIICDKYAVTGEVVIGPIGSLSGFLVLAQIPDALITGAKIADNTISTLKIQNDAITADKIAAGAVEAAEIADLVITNAKISATAAIAESKLSLAYTTTVLHNDIITRQLTSEKNAANGYCGLDASIYVPLARLANIANTQIAAGAGIVESKLTLNFPTHSNASDHTRSHALNSGSDHTGDIDYTQCDAIVNTSGAGSATKISRSDHVHTGSDGSSQVGHDSISGVTANQHHVEFVKTTTQSEYYFIGVSEIGFQGGNGSLGALGDTTGIPRRIMTRDASNLCGWFDVHFFMPPFKVNSVTVAVWLVNTSTENTITTCHVICDATIDGETPAKNVADDANGGVNLIGAGKLGKIQWTLTDSDLLDRTGILSLMFKVGELAHNLVGMVGVSLKVTRDHNS